MDLLPSGLPKEVAPDEEMVRLLRSSTHYSSKGVKCAAFLPNLKNMETSVFRRQEESENEIRNLWATSLQKTGVKWHGAAIVGAEQIMQAGLKIQAKEPPPFHANLVGWPQNPDDPQLQKAQQLEIAREITKHAYKLPP